MLVVLVNDLDRQAAELVAEMVKRKLKGGLVVSADVAWNASLWDFADEFDVPSYNYKGSLGLTFFSVGQAPAGCRLLPV